MVVLTRLPAPRTDSRPHPRIVNQLAGGNKYYVNLSALSKTGHHRGCGLGGAPSDFQANWSDDLYFLSFLVRFSCSSTWKFATGNENLKAPISRAKIVTSVQKMAFSGSFCGAPETWAKIS
jgi:hypothetical protein